MAELIVSVSVSFSYPPQALATRTTASHTSRI
jgi:hypothetical protein